MVTGSSYRQIAQTSHYADPNSRLFKLRIKVKIRVKLANKVKFNLNHKDNQKIHHLLKMDETEAKLVLMQNLFSFSQMMTHAVIEKANN